MEGHAAGGGGPCAREATLAAVDRTSALMRPDFVPHEFALRVEIEVHGVGIDGASALVEIVGDRIIPVSTGWAEQGEQFAFAHAQADVPWMVFGSQPALAVEVFRRHRHPCQPCDHAQRGHDAKPFGSVVDLADSRGIHPSMMQ